MGDACRLIRVKSCRPDSDLPNPSTTIMKPAAFPVVTLLAISLPSLALAAKGGRAQSRPARQSAGDLAEVLKPFDKNGNHQIDADELVAVQKAFSALGKLDKNANGEIEQSEVASASSPTRPGAPGGRLARAAEGLKRVDKNGNRRIDPDEIPQLEKMLTAGAGEMMKRLDQNGNGKLEESEVARLNERLEKGMAGRGGATGGSSATPGFRRPPEKPQEKPAENKSPAETIKPAEKSEKSTQGEKPANAPKPDSNGIKFGT